MSIYSATRPKSFSLILATVLTVTALAAPAAAQPTLSKVFTPNTIGPGSVSTVTLTITNGSGIPVTGLSFTDTLPGPVTIADPGVLSTSCDLGPTGTLTGPDGGSTITLTDAQIPASSSCTVTVDVTSSTVGMHTNPAITLNSDAGSNMSLPVDLTVATDRPGFSKSFSPDSIDVGERSTLTLVVDNSANASDLSSLVFTDVLPSGLLVADPANASTTCAGPNPQFTAIPGTDTVAFQSFGLLFPGFEVMLAGETCTTTVDVVAVGGGIFDNVTSDLTSNVGSSGKASDTLVAALSPLQITKSFTDDPVAVGGTATLEFTLANFDRLFSATSLAFTDDLTTLVPALPGLTFDSVLFNDCGTPVTGAGGTTISFSGGTLAPESSCTIRVSLSVPLATTPGVFTNTTSAITATVGGSPVVGNQASDALFVAAFPVITKTFLDNPVEPGDTTTLEFTITNTSPSFTATDIAFEDRFATIMPTASVTPGNGCCGAGSICMFTPLSNPPPPNDVVPATLSISGGTLAPAGMAGDSCTFQITLDLLANAPSGLYPNTTSQISATVDGVTAVGPPATDTLEVVAAPVLSKAFDGPVAPGDTVTLEFTLTHDADAPADATGITFTDDLAPVLAGLTANLPSTPDPPCGAGSSLTGSVGDTLLTLMNGTLMPGESCTFSVTLDVPAGAASGTYTNTTSGVSATVQGLPLTSAAASAELTVAGLMLTKEFIGDPTFPGTTIPLRFTLENISPTDDVTSIGFTDDLALVLPGVPDLTTSLPPTTDTCGGTPTLLGTFFIYAGGSVTVGSTCVIELNVTIPAGIADGSYSNTTSSVTAIIGGSVFVGDPATDFLVIDTNFLQLTKEFTDDPVAPGDNVTLEFTLTNLDGANAAAAVAFSDNLGAALTGLTFDSILLDTCGGTVVGTGTDMIDVSAVSLAAGASCTLRVSLAVPGGALAGAYINTTSGVTGMINLFPVNGTPATDVLGILNLLDFSKSFDGPTTATGTATLSFTITNPGADTVLGLSFTDDLDAVIPGLIAIGLPATPCGMDSSITGISLLTFSGGELDPLDTCSFDVDVLVPATATAGTFPNTTSALFQSGLEVAEPATADLTIEPPPTFAKVFAPDVIGVGLTSTLTFTIDNTTSVLAADNLDFTDNLPPGIVITNPAVTANTCGGTLTAVAGTAVITLTGGSVGAGATCTISVDVTGAMAGAFVNTTGNLTSTSGNSGTATDTLTLVAPPTFAKAFSPDTIAQGGVSTLTFTIDNTASPVAATGLGFTDNLPVEITVATPANVVNTCTGGTVTAVDGSGVISYSGGTVAAASTCTISVDVTSSTTGTHTNLTGDLVSSLGNSGTATDDLTVVPPPTFAKAFSPDTIAQGDVSTLTFTIDNTASTLDATALDFTDNLPVEITVATPANVVNTCTGGTVTAVDGSGVISYTGGTVSASSTCTISVDVTSSTSGTHTNLTGDLTSSLGNSGSATDDLTVVPPPTFAKAFNPDTIAQGDVSLLTFTIDNTASTLDATALDFTDNLPVEITVATPANVVNGCGGTVTAVSGTSVISLTGGSVTGGMTCTLSVEVTSSTVGDHVNLTGDLTSSLGNSGTATDSLRVNPPKGFSKAFAPNPIAVDGISTLTFTIDNTGSTVDATGLDFTDNLPAGLVVANPDHGMNDCVGGTLTAVPGSGVITYTGGTVPAMSVCTVSVDVTSDTAGVYVNITGDLTSSNGNSGTATDILTVNPPPGFAKVFAPNPIGSGGVSTLTFTIDNSGSTAEASALDFTDNLPSPMVVASPANASTDCTGGTLTATSGTAVISYSGGTVAAGATCTISVDVTSPSAGTLMNVSGSLTSSLGDSGPATDTLDVLNGELGITKTFASAPVPPLGGTTPEVLRGGLVMAVYTISNASPTFTATAITFSDDLDAALPGFAALGLPANDVCGAGSQISGTTVVTLTGGVLPPNSSCTIEIVVQVPADAPLGTVTSPTGPVSADYSGVIVTGGPASADLEVVFIEFLKEFSDGAVVGELVDLTFTLVNPDPANGITDLMFTDDLDAVLPGLEAIGLPENDVCGTGSVLTGTSLITLTGGVLDPGGSCTFTVTLQLPQTTFGEFENVTSVLEGTVGGLVVVGDPAGVATATLEVAGSPIDIPTLGGWGLMALVGLLAALGVRRLRR